MPSLPLKRFEPPWVRRRVCGLRDLQVRGSGSSLPVVMFELNRGQVPDRGVKPVGVVPVDPAGDLPFDVSSVGSGFSQHVELSPVEASVLLGVSSSRVRQLLRSGVLYGRRVGRSWLVERSAVESYAGVPRGVVA